MKILITGISGAMARQLARALHAQGHTVVGIDRRPWPDAPEGITVHRVDVRKRPAEEVFRTERPQAVFHMATVTYFSARADERTRINLGGTQAVWERSARYGVEQVIFVGRHTVYGAAADAPIYRDADEPLLAGTTFPTLADLVAADLWASTALWRYPDMRTAVVRLVYTLGPSRRGTLASYLSDRRVPTILGYDPLFQFMHEEDAVRALGLTLEHKLKGIFNIAGPQPLPLSVICRAVGQKALPVPAAAFASLTGRLGFSRLPKASINHLKYPVVVDDRPFREATGFSPRYDEQQTLEAFRWS